MSVSSVRSAWFVVACAALIVTVSMGVRQSFGLFLVPMSSDLGFGRDVLSLSVAIQNLIWGLSGPFIGILADRYGAGRVVAGGAVVYAIGLVLAAAGGVPLDFHLTLGLLIGLALGATTFGIVFGAVARAVAPEQRAFAMGIVGAGGSFGQFALVPTGQALLSATDWATALILLCVPVALMVGLAVGVSGRPATSANTSDGQSLREASGEAFGHSGYWLLTAGFFVCGFHVAFIATHLPAYLKDQGLSAEIGAAALALIGLANIAGSLIFGALGGRYRKKYLLSVLYLMRSVSILLFIMVPMSNVTALAFALAIGFLWLGTVPLTSGLIAQMFGVRHLSMLYGVVFLGHQVGSFMGVWLGGLLFESTGSYDVVWWMGIALGGVAALLHWPIRDAPMPRLRPAAAAE